MSKTPFTPVKADVQLPALEEEILTFWDNQEIFKKSLREEAPFYSFYDGPPFATGLPHYGHILAGVLKDIVPRYWTMKGYQVPRRFGWDCHGLPVEHEINKTLGLENRKQILEMGVAQYNQACRSIVQRYSSEWKKSVRRCGRWVDMENAYFTMNVDFMQSVWWVFKELWNKGLIYEGHKVVPYSVGISTPLSNFEANLNYKQVQDPAITVKFKIIGQKETYVLAWTTTPWTLPSNLALAVSQEAAYVRFIDRRNDTVCIVAETLFSTVTQGMECEILGTLSGSELLDWTYEPLFPYFADLKEAFRIIHSDHVTLTTGTGIVHLAPAFGEEDYYACQKAAIPLVNPIDDDGLFTHEVPLYEGKRAKASDPEIIQYLKQKNLLFKQETITHSYPFCWRTDTPLIYRAVSSWFVAVEKIKDALLKNNQKTEWVPDHLRDGRFGNWLENARDWAISRNRFWGTPLPIWKNEEGETLCIGSKEELESLSGQRVSDLHMEHIDPIEIPSPTGKSALKRTGGVLDCWFESGSMPYAQWGFPKTHQDIFKKTFPADFIAEGLDQTRGWFYTLMVIGTALFDQAPFKNVIVNGLVLAEDGKKMSKSLKNYPDPMEVLNQHGADALRLYLMDSPVVKAQELRFSEQGVKDVVRKILLRWWNSYSFFVNYANIDHFSPRSTKTASPNLLDQWLLSKIHGLIENTEREMSLYRLYNVVPALLEFIEELTNTYIRFNRRHFWKEGMPEDKQAAYETLHDVLLLLSKIMAPFAPFLSELTYQNLSKVLAEHRESVHLEDFPKYDISFRKPELEEAVKVMETLVLLGRNYREKISIKTKIPLRSIKIIHRDSRVLENLKLFESYFQEELNIREVHYDSNEDHYVTLSAKANFQTLGKRLGSKMKEVASEIQKLSLVDLLTLEKGERLILSGETIQLSDVEMRRAPQPGHPHLTTHQWVSIEVDPKVDEEQIREGLAREVIRKIQAARKNADFILDDRISLELCAGPSLERAIVSFQSFIQKETLATHLLLTANPKGFHQETVIIQEEELKIAVTALPK